MAQVIQEIYSNYGKYTLQRFYKFITFMVGIDLFRLSLLQGGSDQGVKKQKVLIVYRNESIYHTSDVKI